MSTRPNILFVSTDQQSWDALSARGNRHLHTPNMDRLCASGVSFLRSYCADPVCSPARACWTTGRYSSENGVVLNGAPIHPDLPDLGQVLRRGGYLAVHCGKWHVPGRDVRQSFENLYSGGRRIGAGGGAYFDSATTHAAISFLAQDHDEPFFLQVNYINPHDVCEYLHNYEHKSIPGPLEQGILTEDELPPLPENFHYDPSETRLHRVSRREEGALIHEPIRAAVARWGELDWRFFRWSYYRYVEKVDQEIGLLLAALEQSSHRDNTLIIFTSDHGEAAGAHQMFQKFSLYEPSVRVPLVISALGDHFDMAKGGVKEHLVSGVDLAPTVCDYAGIPPEGGYRGRSLRPLIEGAAPPWRSFVYIESNYWGRAIIGERYKYVTEYVPSDADASVPPGPDGDRLGIEQLFDLESDPDERRNLSDDPQQSDRLSQLRQQLLGFEATLERRPLQDGRHRAVIDRWAARLRV